MFHQWQYVSLYICSMYTYIHVYVRTYMYTCTYVNVFLFLGAMVDKARVEEAEARVFDLQHNVRTCMLSLSLSLFLSLPPSLPPSLQTLLYTASHYLTTNS